MDKGGIDEDEVKVVPQWKAKGIGEVVCDGPPSKQQSKGMTSQPANYDDDVWTDSSSNVRVTINMHLSSIRNEKG